MPSPLRNSSFATLAGHQYKKIGGCVTTLIVYTPSTAARSTSASVPFHFRVFLFTMRRVSGLSLFTFLIHSNDVKLTLPSSQTVLHVSYYGVSPAFILAFCK